MELAVKGSDYGLEEKQSTEITKGLSTILEERELLTEAYKDVITLEITEENQKTFKELRLQIRDNRTKGIEKWRKTNKAYFLAGGNFVQAIYNKEVIENERMEAKLMEAEKHFENLEAEKMEKLHAERKKLILPYEENDTLKDLGHMEQQMFDNLLLGAKTSHENRIAAAKKVEEERIAKEEAEKLHAERKELLLPYWNHVPIMNKDDNFSKFTNVEWDALIKYCKEEKEKEEAKQLETQKENERLQKEAESKAKRDSKRNEELMPYIIYIRKYDWMLNLEEVLYEKEFSELVQAKKENEEFLREEAEKEQKKKDEAEGKRLAEAKVLEDKLKKQREESDKLKKELQDKKDEDAKADKQRLLDIEVEANKGDAAKVSDLKADLASLKEKYTFKSAKNKKMYSDIGELIDKVINHIK